MPVYQAYESVCEILNPDRQFATEALRNSMLEFRRQIFKDSRVKVTVEDWDESTFWEHYKYTPSQWREIDLHDRAVMKARLILHNMVEIVDRYHEAMAEKRRKKGGE